MPALFCLFLLFCPIARPYSVQTHQQIVDLTWHASIEPLLVARYPGITPAQLRTAHAYAYGGSAIQDLGYYPFGNEFFSDLTHYVRPGDFVVSLIRNASNANELAFAIGALSHYMGDTIGHSGAVNPSVAVEFPKLSRRFGNSIAYEDDEHAHVRTEFAFDINEIAKRRFAPLHYLRHVGLGVPTHLLSVAFYETYGLDADRILGNHRSVLRGYRFGVRSFLPRIAYAETVLHRGGMPPDTPGPELDKLVADLTQAATENNWEPYRRKPGIGTYTLAGLIFILPKVGVLSDLAIRGPVPFTEDLYVSSVNRTAAELRLALRNLPRFANRMPNLDLDTGATVRPGGYRLADRTYAKLLERVTSTPEEAVPPALKRDLIAYFADPNAPIETRKHAKQWAAVQENLKTIAGMRTSVVPPALVEAEELTPP